MNRLSFLKRLFIGGATTVVAPKLLANDNSNLSKKEFSFDELFITHEGNKILIYPKKESLVYQEIQKTFIDRLNVKKHHTYLPVHHLSIQVKETYTIEDFLPVKYYFESVYGKMNEYTVEDYSVSYRFVKDGSDRMHLEVFLASFFGLTKEGFPRQ